MDYRFHLGVWTNNADEIRKKLFMVPPAGISKVHKKNVKNQKQGWADS